MYGLNYAGIVLGNDHMDQVLTYCEQKGWFGALPVHIFHGGFHKAVSSVVSKSCTDSTEIVKMSNWLLEREVPFRLFSVPHHTHRVMESFSHAPYGVDLTIHHHKRDQMYQVNLNKAVRTYDGQTIEKYVVVGPHVHARKAYRQLSFWWREHTDLNSWVVSYMQQKMDSAKVYLQTDANRWIIIDRHEIKRGLITGDLINQCNVAKINGLSSGMIKN